MSLEKLAVLLCFMPRSLFEERKKGKEKGKEKGREGGRKDNR